MDKFILLIVIFLLAGAIPLHGGLELAIFRTPVFWALLAILAVWCVVACFRLKRFKSLRGIGFLLAHGGVALLLLGAAIGLFAGKKTQFAAYIGASPANELPAPDNTTYPLDFSLAVTDLKVEYYPPSYNYYAPPEKDGEDYTLLKTLKPNMDGTITLPKHGGSIARETLVDDDGNWKPQVFMDNGYLLHKAAPTPKLFEATAQLSVSDGDVLPPQKFSVNHPLCFHGWRFYLMSYDVQNNEYIVLTARHDPGRGCVIAGIWMIIIGVAILCWFSQSPTEVSRNV
ncbi:MAG: cytochrome c biogenesis protein ResB [Lentisphaeria bacterium]|nr:cytochrome c biogenesis protein ResB [Lentisphaeria bacterium]